MCLNVCTTVCVFWVGSGEQVLVIGKARSWTSVKQQLSTSDNQAVAGL